jgi:hypothetical protein
MGCRPGIIIIISIIITTYLALRESRGIGYSVLDLGTRRGDGSASRLGRFLPPGKDPVPIVQEAGVGPRADLVLTYCS